MTASIMYIYPTMRLCVTSMYEQHSTIALEEINSQIIANQQ